MRSFIKKNTWLAGIPTGWGNGYVVIPKGHPLHGVHYDDIDVSVHGGLTFSEPANELDWEELGEEDKNGWVVGFDTAHFSDTLSTWPREAVSDEVNQLKKQLVDYNKKAIAVNNGN